MSIRLDFEGVCEVADNKGANTTSGRRLAGLLVFLLLTVVGSASHAFADDKVQTVERLRAALELEDLALRVFTKGDRVRLYFSSEGRHTMFKADWDRSRVNTHGFSYHMTTLQYDASPPSLTKTGKKWRETKVLAREGWEDLVKACVEDLAPSEPEHGLYLQLALGEHVLYRTAEGEIDAVAFAEAPPGITIDGRLNRIEFVAALANAIESDLRADYPEEEAFALVPLEDDLRNRIYLVDLANRRVVLMLAPQTGDDTRGGVRVGSNFSSLATFVLVDHGWAGLKNPVSSLGRAGNMCLQWSLGLFKPSLKSPRMDIPPVNTGPGMDLTEWEDWLDAHSGTARERGSVKLLIDGESFFPVFEKRLAEAAKGIDFQVCIFDRDDVAVRIADLLKQKSSDVEVRVIYDHSSSRMSGSTPPATPMEDGFVMPKSIHQYLKADSEVKVRPFLNPLMTSDHSKVYLIDEEYAYIGGMNLGREYRYEWHDLMAEITGPIVASLQGQFERHWAHAGTLGDLSFAAHVIFDKQPESVVPDQDDFIDIRRIYTKTGRRQIRRAVLESIKRARNHVFIENPYLFDRKVIVALAKARLRGVDVRVVFPSENNFPGGPGSNLVTANYFIRNGVRVYFYPGMSHVKVILADGWACFGSANFNTLSLRLNQEANVATSAPEFVTRLRKELFETDFEKSFELKEVVPVGWSDHLANSIVNQF